MELQSLINIALILSTALLFVLAIELRKLVHACIMLGAGSAVLACVFFLAGAPFAAAFELVVGAGLVTVLFISAISLTKPGGGEE
jgi:NADH-quinone oxidoreductase subunit J